MGAIKSQIKSLKAYGRTYVSTSDGRIYLSKVDNKDKRKILNAIRKDWRAIIDKHFQEKGMIQSNGVKKWRPLSERYLDFKRRNGLHLGILEASEPDLKTRYKNSITTRTNTFNISMDYPMLITGAKRKNPQPVNAGIHQLGTIKRRIVKKNFIDSAKKRLTEYFS